MSDAEQGGGGGGEEAAETARGFPWLLPPVQGVHVLQQAHNTHFPGIVFAELTARGRVPFVFPILLRLALLQTAENHLCITLCF